MRRIALVTCLLLAYSLAGLAQSGGLELTKVKTQKTSYVKSGKKIRVISDHKTYRGRLEAISDSTITVGSDTLHLASIQDIRTKSLLNGLGGGLIFFMGTYMTLGMIYAIALTATEGASLVALGVLFFGTLGVGSALIAAGGIALMIHGKTHKSHKWKYKTAASLP